MSFITSAYLKGDETAALQAHRYVMRYASSLASAFMWILVFQYFALSGSVGTALVRTLMLYALAQTVAMLLVPFAMRRMRGGLLRGMVYGTVLFTTALVYVGALLQGIFPHGSAFIGILLGAHIALYRVPYAIESVAMKSVRTSSLVGEAMLAAAPLIVGFLLVSSVPAQLVYFGAALLTAVSLIPLLFVPNVHEDFSWKYRETFGKLIADENRLLLYGAAWRGAIGALLMFVWPLVLLLVTPSFLVLGAVYSATLLALLLFRVSRSTATMVAHADGGAYLDEYTALKEMGISLGRLSVAAILTFTIILLML